MRDSCVFRFRNLIVLLFLLLMVYALTIGVWAWRSLDVLAIEALESPFEPISDKQRVQLLQVVDPTFYSHSGINFAPGQGNDTITSEVSRMVLLEGEDLPGLAGLIQKHVRQMHRCCDLYDPSRYVMALVTHFKVTKKQQLQIYLANAYLGRYQGKPVFGYPSASIVYFDRRLASLTEDQWLSLVALELDPVAYHPIEYPDALMLRVRRIEHLLSGLCVAKNLRDVEYEACDPSSEWSFDLP